MSFLVSQALPHGRGSDYAAPGSDRTRAREGALASLILFLAAALFLPAAGHAATRPQYGGRLRVEVREIEETPDPSPPLGRGVSLARWEAGRLAVDEADENASGGQPYLAGVEVLLGRALRDQAGDL